MKIKSISGAIAKILIFLFFLTILLTSIRGIYGNPSEKDLLKPDWRNNGPFELSPERGRFALLYSLVENKSFYFSTDIAKFILPDLGYKNGHYVSLFAPMVSFVAMPGYIIGKELGASQYGAFSVIAVFALINLYLIKKISVRLGASETAGTLGGIVFVFATPAFAYATNLYQHHISAFLILSAIYLLISSGSFISLAAIWLLCAASIPVDYPNIFLMLPIGIFALGKLFYTTRTKTKIKISVKTVKLLSFAAVLIPLGFFLWFNKESYGNPLQFSGTVATVTDIDANGKPVSRDIKNPEDVAAFLGQEEPKKSAFSWFDSRRILNGLDILITSPDRGTIVYTPVIFFGIIGAWLLYKEKNKYLPVFLAIIGADLLLYSMWGDPWGGWAFGARYLIPAYAVAAILIAIVLSRLGEKWWIIIPFWLLLICSVSINTLGAITTSAIPPKTEALPLEKLSGKRERYSFDRNWEYLNTQGSKSFVYKTLLYKYLTPVNFYYILTGSIMLVSTGMLAALALSKNEKHQT